MHGPAMKGRENVFKLIFDEARCKGCGLCVHACPKGVLALKKDILNDKGYHPAGRPVRKTASGAGAAPFSVPTW